MKARNLLIPVAAFAVTVTGASAFSGNVLQSAGLTDDQIAAFEEARELREEGDRDGARDVLVAAGIDQETMEGIRDAMHQARDAVHEAVENDDYDAFLTAVQGSPLADIITSKTDFEQFVEAHQLMEKGDRDAAQAIFDDLGVERPAEGMGPRGEGPGKIENAPFWDQLSSDDQQAILSAIENHDRDTVKQILDDAGITPPAHGPHNDRDDN